MNELTFRKLEYEKIITMLEQECSSALGKEVARALTPGTDYDEVVRWQEETTEGVLVMRMEPNIPLGGINDIRHLVRKAEIGGVLEGAEFLNIMDLCRASRRLHHFFIERKVSYEIPHFQWWASQLVPMEALERAIDDVIAPEGIVRDNASPTLVSLRRKMGTLRNKIKERLDGILRGEGGQKYLQDAIVTIRNDRYVVPVKQEYRSQVPGIVHDQSASGATLFVEPMAVLELNNDLRKTMSAERDELIRILTELSLKVAPYVEDLRNNMDVLAHIDFVFAKARLSNQMDGLSPRPLKEPKLSIIKGRHPLIDKKTVVPLTISLGNQYDVVIITGPNTGGKTVTIKTVGLFALMYQAGLHIPCEVGSSMGIFQKVFADIGDEQSIEQSLSTFSSHMTNIVEIMKYVDGKTLVLLDELGAGTDPAEGAALAIAILDVMKKDGAKIISTTHYGDLKAYAFNEDRVENASVEFDIETLKPTYRLMMGIPGKSNALAIAYKLGIQKRVIDKAQHYITEDERDVAELIQSLESKNIQAEKNEQETALQLAQAQEELQKLKEERAKFAQKTDQMRRRAEEEAKEIVKSARLESEAILKEMRQIQKQHTDMGKMENEAQLLRKKLSVKEEKLGEKLAKGPKVIEGKLTAVEIGQEVYIPRFSNHGVVLSAPNTKGELQVQVGIMKVKVNLNELQSSKKKEAEKPKGAVHIVTNKTAEIKSEIDLRGMLVDDALIEVDKYLDDAYLSSLGQVSIIHGKGTGALRSAITDMLKHNRYVQSYRLGGFSEGGAGVTIVELKK